MIIRLFFIALGLSTLASAVPEDTNENCRMWAEGGECDKNPGYMTSNCAASCEYIAAAALKDEAELKGISFFDLSAKDIMGKTLDFREFEGQVTLVVNVASECGYTDSHYRQLVKLWSLVKHTGKINILAFPCNQFGRQEPGTSEEILEFATEEYGVEFTIMEKVDVNGPNASLVYKYLKAKAGPATIGWNFATYFVVSPDGMVNSYSGEEPLRLKDTLLGFLPGDEL